MYKDNEISSNFYNEYYKLVHLSKEKCAASAKLYDLERILTYFIDNYKTLNEEEKKLIKNIIILATSITSKTNTYYNYVKAHNERCLSLTKNLKNKQKEPTK